MSIKQKKTQLVLGGLFSVVVLSGCSNLVTDHGLDYQTAESSDVELELPAGRYDISDKMIIPNEDRVAALNATGEFEAPRAPKPFLSMAYVPMVFDQYQVTYQIPASLEQSKKLITDYFSSLSGEEVVFNAVSEAQLVSAPIQLDSQGSLAKLWSSITRLKPTQYRVTANFAQQSAAVDVSVSVVAIDAEGREENVDLTLNETIASQMVNAWSHMSRDLTVETVLLSNQSKEPVLKSRIWTNRDDKLALYLGKEADAASVDQYIRSTSGIHITNDMPKELALVPQNELAKVGDIVDFKVPLGALSENKDVILFKVRRRNLDDVPWTERSYPYQLIRQQEGYFLTVDTSATDNPALTSYRILSLLAK